MVEFTQAYAALQDGKQIRHQRWDGGSVMFVRDGELMYSCRGGAPRKASSDMLDWRDMNTTGWTIL